MSYPISMYVLRTLRSVVRPVGRGGRFILSFGYREVLLYRYLLLAYTIDNASRFTNGKNLKEQKVINVIMHV